MFWEIGNIINTAIPGDNRAEYGKRIFPALSGKLVLKYGSSFDYTNIRRMIQFAARFPKEEKVGGWDTVILKKEYEQIFENKPVW